MKERPDFVALLDALYASADDPAAWTPFLSSLCALTGTDNAALLIHDLRTGRPAVYWCHFHPAEAERYIAKYAALNPWMPTPEAKAPPGMVLRGEMFVSLEEVRETEFYREWGRKNDVVHSVALNLGIAEGRFTYLALNSGEKTGPITERAVRLLERLGPHVQRVVRIQTRMAEAATFAEALERTAGAVFFVSARGRLLGVTPSAQELLGRGTVVQVDGAGRLVGGDRRSSGRLSEALAKVGQGQNYATSVLPEGHLAVISRLGGPRRVITVIDPRKSSGGVELAGAAFGLTPAEIRLVGALMEAGTLSDAARALGISRETAKTQLRAVFARTGTVRQADVVRIVCSVGLLSHFRA